MQLGGMPISVAPFLCYHSTSAPSMVTPSFSIHLYTRIFYGQTLLDKFYRELSSKKSHILLNRLKVHSLDRLQRPLRLTAINRLDLPVRVQQHDWFSKKALRLLF